jgi:ethanolamine transporter EutH
MPEISLSVAALALVVVGLVGLIVASSQKPQGVKLPAGITVKLDADSATPLMRAIVALVSVAIIVLGAYLFLVLARVAPFASLPGPAVALTIGLQLIDDPWRDVQC